MARKAQAKEDYMWELNFPFPYDDILFEEIYTLFLEVSEKKDKDGIRRCRKNLREMLNTDDYEYMVWQEWKEGLARYIENQIRRKLDLEENHSSTSRPFNRVTFYEGGAGYIDFLMVEDKTLSDDIESLFLRMLKTTF